MTLTFPSMQHLLGRAWLRMLIAICILLLLHLPFSLLTIHSVRSSQPKPGIHLPAVVSLPSSSSPGLSRFERDLYAWTNIADPRRMLHPDMEQGFSRFGYPVFSYPAPVLPVWALEAWFWPRKEYPESSLAVASKTLKELIREQWNRHTKIYLLPFEKVAFPEGVFFRLSGSSKRIRDLLMPAEFASLAGNSDEVQKITGLTILEVSSLAVLPYPRIVLRKSCGNIRFDQLAVLAIKEHLLSRRRQMEVSKEPSPQRIAQSWLIEVDWRLKKLGKSP